MQTRYQMTNASPRASVCQGDFRFDPPLTQPRYDTQQDVSEHLAKLSFNFSLDELLNGGDEVECTVDAYVSQDVGLGDKGDVLFANDKDYVRVKSEMGQTEERRYDWGFLAP